jgi:beta-galactosidase
MDEEFVQKASAVENKKPTRRQGQFFKGTFELAETGDTYFDMQPYAKGVLFVNGHNLGRYWNKGPQQRLYCPASWLLKGGNEVVLFDLHQMEAKPIFGKRTLE